MLTSLKVFSPAKINLHLEIAYLRPDGYSELRTIFQTLDVGDEIFFEKLSNRDIVFSSDNDEIPSGNENLCVKAAELLLKEYNSSYGVRIYLEKNLPVQGGLGGGSSNAAATLIGLNKLWNLELPLFKLMELGTMLGSDVPFFLYGGTSLGIGRGNEIIPLEDLPAYDVLLLCPGFSISTPWAFKEYNLLLTKKELHNTISPLFRAIFDGNIFSHQNRNDLEIAVFPHYPALQKLKDKLMAAGALFAMMSGSGSTMFGIFQSGDRCRKAEKLFKSEKNLRKIIRTKFLSGPEFRSKVLVED